MTNSPILRIAFVGWGAIARATARLLADEPVEIVAIAVRDAAVERSARPTTALLISDPSELAATEPQLVIEAAGRDSVGPWAAASLDAGVDFVIASVSALTDTKLFESLTDRARTNGCQLHIPPGALGGIGALAAARSMGIKQVEHRIVKPPLAWNGTPAETLCDLAALTEAAAFFSGSADQAAAEFPKNANVAMTTALAGLGPADTRITLIADPAASGNRHEISASGDFGELSITIRNEALPENPKSSAMTALSLHRLVHNLVSPVVI